MGLLGVVSFLSYTAAVVFAPLAYPGYNWMAQAVSDLSAANAPSLALWNQLSALYNVCEVVCVTVVCIGIQGWKTKLLTLAMLQKRICEYKGGKPSCSVQAFICSPSWSGYRRSGIGCSR